MEELIYFQKQFYEELVDKNPDLEIFLKGWLKRASFDPTKIG
jgi:hypothetical protein